MTNFDFVQKYEIQIFHFIDTLSKVTDLDLLDLSLWQKAYENTPLARRDIRKTRHSRGVTYEKKHSVPGCVGMDPMRVF